MVNQEQLYEITEYPPEAPLQGERNQSTEAATGKTETNKRNKKSLSDRFPFLSVTVPCVKSLPLNQKFCLFHLARCAHLLLSAGLLIFLAQYGQLVGQSGSSVFSLLFFALTISTVILMILVVLRKFWNNLFDVHKDLPCRAIARNACFFAVGLTVMSLCREKNHVPCNLQDTLLLLIVPFSIIYLTYIKRKDPVNKNQGSLIAMLSSFMCLVYLGAIPQLANTYSCRGLDIPKVGQSEDATQFNTVWMAVYIFSIALLSISLSGFWSNIHNYEKSESFCMKWTLWFHVASLSVMICLFWVNLLPSVGGSNGLGDFFRKLGSIWVSHFSSSSPISTGLGLYISVAWLLFIYLSNLLVHKFCANPIVVFGNACLALPLLSIFFGLFQMQQSAIEFKGTFITLGSIFGIVTLPISYAVLSSYQSATRVLHHMDYFDVY